MTYDQVALKLAEPQSNLNIYVDSSIPEQRAAAKAFISKFTKQTGFNTSKFLETRFERNDRFDIYNGTGTCLYAWSKVKPFEIPGRKTINILDIELDPAAENNFMELL